MSMLMWKIVIIGVSLILFGLVSKSQEIILPNAELSKRLNVHDTLDLQFINSPGAGVIWNFNCNYDSSVISIKYKSYKLMSGDFPIGGRYIGTIQYQGLKAGKIMLVYSYGRQWLKDDLSYSRIELIINE
jgi:predicted secreted protein